MADQKGCADTETEPQGNKMACDLTEEERIDIVRKHFEAKGYRVHSGLQFGVELVLYSDSPTKVHSDFCVHVVSSDGRVDWRVMQTLVRSMPDLHKTLILASVRNSMDDSSPYAVDELAIATEHAPFRHKKQTFVEVGSQVKKQKVNNDTTTSDVSDQKN
eukprot:scaffold280_cov50-Attheya_sp.AAC.2